MEEYDVIVVGGGHAGCEAALVSARTGCRTLLLSISLDMVAHMPCSPSIGGLGKGHLVKELDALGGEMAKVADRTAIQFRLLNTSKGPAVQGTRTQNDKVMYRGVMKSVLERQPRLDIKQSLVEEVIVGDGRVRGVRDSAGAVFMAKAVVLTAGTFLHGLVHIGESRTPSGRAGEFPADRLGDCLRAIGFDIGRMKTGTPMRIHRRSIDYDAFTEQPPDGSPRPFSMFTGDIPLPQVPCFIGRTDGAAHRVVRDNITRSALYSGAIQGVSARYCPSLEDKIVKFADRESHQIILEPEGLDTDEVYVSGTGNSLPYDIQLELLHSIRGLGRAELMRPAYAIEYDFVQPTQLRLTLETRLVRGLYLAGQVNGTSGYEEAAAQGFWAGANAALAVQGRPPFILDRSEGYMGVMVDDLVTKGTNEPYRMFTSRAEYRLLFREDNAVFRLLAKGCELGLHARETLDAVNGERCLVDGELSRLAATRVKPGVAVNAHLAARSSTPLRESVTLDQLLKRPELGYGDIMAVDPECPELPGAVRRHVEVECKYEPYLARQQEQVEKFRHLERMKLPDDIDFPAIPGLSAELRQKLADTRPANLGQASRIPGMTPAAISVLMVWLKRWRDSREVRGSGGG